MKWNLWSLTKALVEITETTTVGTNYEYYKVLYYALKVDCALQKVLTLTKAMGIATLLTDSSMTL